MVEEPHCSTTRAEANCGTLEVEQKKKEEKRVKWEIRLVAFS